MADYKEAPLATRPKTLDPNEYFNLSPEYRRAEEARTAMRANLKRQYQMQLNNPYRNHGIDDPAVTRWVYGRANPFHTPRVTGKTSLLGMVFGVAPLFICYYLFKTSRDKQEEEIKAGKERTQV
ncbi:LOW QUALITY PROTEIN: NADH dehydrogenase [ubiquinone] 1 beta subcomplex subunit 4 [Thalassophryne amazonica]|uniref:LOW QUALITY PROTEIN: NADH dehydrogenase [ubiquinone] 1 beta subcomplex subunit 4 n=1 Tax=Thalassophryne amazonica TaxID=390379 RepID=UPI0014726B4B|nr:LOW QUALITY PROTEIN: NADH dehydrogenase [ubiquinone] 1 beta subcomplex subunit 4 [Thalassophryne amazonica]